MSNLGPRSRGGRSRNPSDTGMSSQQVRQGLGVMAPPESPAGGPPGPSATPAAQPLARQVRTLACCHCCTSQSQTLDEMGAEGEGEARGGPTSGSLRDSPRDRQVCLWGGSV